MHLRSALLALLATATAGFCQQSTLDAPYKVWYASHLDNPIDSVVDIINTGGNGGVPPFGPQFGAANSGNICVNVYAFDSTEELVSCCSCMITPDQVKELKVGEQILAVGTLTGFPVSSMTLKLIGSSGAAAGSYPSSCATSAATVSTAAGSTNYPVGGYIAFGTTVHAGASSTYRVSESEFIPSILSGDGSELRSLTTRCAFIVGNGSGFGQCGGCNAGALGAAKQ